MVLLPLGTHTRRREKEEPAATLYLRAKFVHAAERADEDNPPNSEYFCVLGKPSERCSFSEQIQRLRASVRQELSVRNNLEHERDRV